MQNLTILVIATRNKGKTAEIRDLLRDFPVGIKNLDDFGPIPTVEEDGSTFDENAYKKASFAARILGMPALADDSGLIVEALGGAPGVRSARYAGENASDAQRCARLLKEIGTGTIHFCGDGEHLLESMLEIPDIRGVDLGQPELMDAKRIYEMCLAKNVAVTHLNPSREDLVSGQAARDYPTGAVFIYYTVNFEEAIEIVNLYNNSTN